MTLNKHPRLAHRQWTRFVLLLGLMTVILAACQTPLEPTSPQATLAKTVESSSSTPAPNPTTTAETPSTLTVCTAKLPESLFPYDGINTAVKANALTLILEGPLERVDGQIQPVIVKTVPSQSNGNVRLQSVSIQAGQPIVDAAGEVVVLKPGVQLRPSGCRTGDCVITWDGVTALEMDQMVVTFHLRENVTWSDGTPLSASDSVFSFNIANDPQAPGLAWAESRTHSYQALNPQTIEWAGIPGFTTAALDHLFWLPLPAHRFNPAAGWEDIVSDEVAAIAPLSYGPFVLVDYESDRMRFEPNPHYYRSDEGLPYLDEVVFRAVPGGVDSSWQLLKSGECDLIDTSFNLAGQPSLLAEIEQDEGYDLIVNAGDSWTQLVFGIQPASFDNGITPGGEDRPDFFGDVRTRQALAACLDREALLAAAKGSVEETWPSFLPPDQSSLREDERIAYDPAWGQELLGLVGWVDHDQDPATPRQGVGIPGVPSGTPLSIDLLINDTPFQQDLAAIIRDSMAVCGVAVAVDPVSPQMLYMPGPDGPLFGRNFDLALLSWQGSVTPDCLLYHSMQVPTSENEWIGTNIAGLVDRDYDTACASAELAMPDEQEIALHEAEKSFIAALPSVPIFAPSQVMVLNASDCACEMVNCGPAFFIFLESWAGDKNCP